MEVFINPDGSISCVYDDDLTNMQIAEELGSGLEIRRASHVEPSETGKWLVDLAPIGGKKFGPFTHRKTALEFEKIEVNRWLATRSFRYE